MPPGAGYVRPSRTLLGASPASVALAFVTVETRKRDWERERGRERLRMIRLPSFIYVNSLAGQIGLDLINREAGLL